MLHDSNLVAADVFDAEELKRICEMPERDFPAAFDMEVVEVPQSVPDDFYAFKDNGASILAVAHLDTVAHPGTRTCQVIETEGGLVVYSRALDDRLGAYVILDMLPKLGVEVDVLLTVGEESCNSTADFFDTEKEYNWVIEFDRGGTDVVMYQYDDPETRALVKASGARVGEGSFSDIAYLEHLGVKAFNWGVGYRDYHGPRSHAYLADTFDMVDHFLLFHDQNKDARLPHLVTERYADYALWLEHEFDYDYDLLGDDSDDSGDDFDDDAFVEYPTIRQSNRAIERYYEGVKRHKRWAV